MTIPSHNASHIQQSDPFAYIYKYKCIQLTTYRRNGAGVPTPVGFAPQGGKLYVTTPGTASKLKRLRNNGHVTLAPCTFKGRLLGESVEGLARILAPEERAVAEQALVHRYGVIYRIALMLQKVRKKQRTYIEILPVQREQSPLVSGEQLTVRHPTDME